MRTAVHRAFWYAKVGLYMDLNSSGGSVSLFNDFLTNCLEGIVFDAGSGVNLTSTEQVTMTNSTLTDVASPLYMYNTPLNGTAIGCAFTTNGTLANGGEVLPTKAYWLLTNCTLTSVTNLTNSSAAVYVTVVSSTMIGDATNVSGISATDTLITANIAAPYLIDTVDTKTGNYIPYSPTYYGGGYYDGWGRAIAVYSNNIFYTDDNESGVHVAPYGTDGSGGSEIVNSYYPIPNPDTRFGASIQGLAIHGGELYALTGYESDNPDVWAYSFTNHSWSGSTPITGGPGGTPTVSCDGFAILPNGNYLVNDQDGDNNLSIYREYTNTTGAFVTNFVDSAKFGSGWVGCTGVVYDPHTTNLFFAVLNDTVWAIFQTNLVTGVTNTSPLMPVASSTETVEEITVPLP